MAPGLNHYNVPQYITIIVTRKCPENHMKEKTSVLIEGNNKEKYFKCLAFYLACLLETNQPSEVRVLG